MEPPGLTLLSALDGALAASVSRGSAARGSAAARDQAALLAELLGAVNPSAVSISCGPIAQEAVSESCHGGGHVAPGRPQDKNDLKVPSAKPAGPTREILATSATQKTGLKAWRSRSHLHSGIHRLQPTRVMTPAHVTPARVSPALVSQVLPQQLQGNSQLSQGQQGQLSTAHPLTASAAVSQGQRQLSQDQFSSASYPPTVFPSQPPTCVPALAHSPELSEVPPQHFSSPGTPQNHSGPAPPQSFPGPAPPQSFPGPGPPQDYSMPDPAAQDAAAVAMLVPILKQFLAPAIAAQAPEASPAGMPKGLYQATMGASQSPAGPGHMPRGVTECGPSSRPLPCSGLGHDSIPLLHSQGTQWRSGSTELLTAAHGYIKGSGPREGLSPVSPLCIANSPATGEHFPGLRPSCHPGPAPGKYVPDVNGGCQAGHETGGHSLNGNQGCGNNPSLEQDSHMARLQCALQALQAVPSSLAAVLGPASLSAMLPRDGIPAQQQTRSGLRNAILGEPELAQNFCCCHRASAAAAAAGSSSSAVYRPTAPDRLKNFLKVLMDGLQALKSLSQHGLLPQQGPSILDLVQLVGNVKAGLQTFGQALGLEIKGDEVSVAKGDPSPRDDMGMEEQGEEVSVTRENPTARINLGQELNMMAHKSGVDEPENINPMGSKLHLDEGARLEDMAHERDGLFLSPEITSRSMVKRRVRDEQRFDEDGHEWHKYSHKTLRTTGLKRLYYACAHRDSLKCPARKIVDKVLGKEVPGPNDVTVTIDGCHNHPPPKNECIPGTLLLDALAVAHGGVGTPLLDPTVGPTPAGAHSLGLLKEKAVESPQPQRLSLSSSTTKAPKGPGSGSSSLAPSPSPPPGASCQLSPHEVQLPLALSSSPCLSPLLLSSSPEPSPDAAAAAALDPLILCGAHQGSPSQDSLEGEGRRPSAVGEGGRGLPVKSLGCRLEDNAPLTAPKITTGQQLSLLPLRSSTESLTSVPASALSPVKDFPIQPLHDSDYANKHELLVSAARGAALSQWSKGNGGAPLEVIFSDLDELIPIHG